MKTFDGREKSLLRAEAAHNVCNGNPATRKKPLISRQTIVDKRFAVGVKMIAVKAQRPGMRAPRRRVVHARLLPDGDPRSPMKPLLPGGPSYQRSRSGMPSTASAVRIGQRVERGARGHRSEYGAVWNGRTGSGSAVHVRQTHHLRHAGWRRFLDGHAAVLCDSVLIGRL